MNDKEVSGSVIETDTCQTDWLLSRLMRTDDVYALNVLQPLLKEGFLPFTNSAMRPVCLAHILNDIVINERRSILEFGSGLSTLLIGRLARQHNLATRLITIEHDFGWVQVLREIIKTERLESFIDIVHAPLQPCSFAVHSNDWYDTDILHSKISNKLFDLVIIDGPPAYEKAKQEARYPAGPFIYGKLAENAAIYLDDAEREGEQLILKKWEEKYGTRFTIVTGTLAYLNIGKAFNPELF